MLRSMTGFGRAEGVVHERKVTVEVRSLNSKQLDLLVKMPSLYREKEVEVRQSAGERIVRGKAEVYIGSEQPGGQRRSPVDAALVRSYYTDLRTLVNDIDPNAQTDLMGLVLRMPEVGNTGREQLDEAEWLGVQALVKQALDAFDAFRTDEGRKLAADLRQRVAHISALLTEVEGFDPARMGRTRERLEARMQELQGNVDRSRLEQELLFYLEKLDINEEKVRLRAHCAYLLETIDRDDQQGRKLGFIAQEMGREINTIGSKSNDADMQRRVVLMKDELEKIKEQVLNAL
ncbi:MAG: YicC/YloC family endoribonuclease [Flavobacteriales bacterium]